MAGWHHPFPPLASCLRCQGPLPSLFIAQWVGGRVETVCKCNDLYCSWLTAFQLNEKFCFLADHVNDTMWWQLGLVSYQGLTPSQSPRLYQGETARGTGASCSPSCLASGVLTKHASISPDQKPSNRLRRCFVLGFLLFFFFFFSFFFFFNYSARAVTCKEQLTRNGSTSAVSNIDGTELKTFLVWACHHRTHETPSAPTERSNDWHVCLGGLGGSACEQRASLLLACLILWVSCSCAMPQYK